MRISLATLTASALIAALGGCGAAPMPEPGPALPVIVTTGIPAIEEDTADRAPPPGFGSHVAVASGLEGHVHALPEGTARLPDFATMASLGSIYTVPLS